MIVGPHGQESGVTVIERSGLASAEPCGCGCWMFVGSGPLTRGGTVHRTDGPCFQDRRQTGLQAAPGCDCPPCRALAAPATGDQ